AVAGLQPAEPEPGARRRQVVAAKARELEKLLRDGHAHGVRTGVLVAGIATAVAEETRHRVFTARLERFAENVQGFVHHFGLLAPADRTSLRCPFVMRRPAARDNVRIPRRMRAAAGRRRGRRTACRPGGRTRAGTRSPESREA